MASARARLASAGVVFVEADTEGLQALNDKVSLQLAMHEPIADIPAYLAATGVSGIGLREIAAGIASPDVQGVFSASRATSWHRATPMPCVSTDRSYNVSTPTTSPATGSRR
jgi:mandelamide amidase